MIDARKLYHLFHTHIQMARELGLNPKKFGSLVNIKLESWKLTLPKFIEEPYVHYIRDLPAHLGL
jgi:hypothetical protein